VAKPYRKIIANGIRNSKEIKKKNRSCHSMVVIS
jgi:hypothetical protein